MLGTPGSETFTADSVIGVSGKPVRIYSIYWVKGAGTEALEVDSGSTDAGTNIIKQASTAATGNYISFHNVGMLFPDGAFLDYPAATTSVTVTYVVEN